MTHIFNGTGHGKSKDSLSAAITNAIIDAMADAGVNGDHISSTTVIVDGYDFDGENFNVKAHISVLDFDLEHEDIYHEIDKEIHERLEHSEAINTAFYVSSYFRHGNHLEFTNDIDNTLEEVLSNNRGYEFTGHTTIDHNFQFLASTDVHEQLQSEIPPPPQRGLSSSPDIPAPEPGLGGLHSDRDGGGKQAA